jgi:hypothetical protein
MTHIQKVYNNFMLSGKTFTFGHINFEERGSNRFDMDEFERKSDSIVSLQLNLNFEALSIDLTDTGILSTISHVISLCKNVTALNIKVILSDDGKDDRYYTVAFFKQLMMYINRSLHKIKILNYTASNCFDAYGLYLLWSKPIKTVVIKSNVIEHAFDNIINGCQNIEHLIILVKDGDRFNEYGEIDFARAEWFKHVRELTISNEYDGGVETFDTHSYNNILNFVPNLTKFNYNNTNF